MKRYLYILLCAALFVGCTKDPLIEEITPGDGKTIKATFTLSPEFVEEIDVRSADGVNENAITNVWVIQLAQDGMTQLQAPQYITTGFTTSASDYKVTVALQRQASKIYFIANTHNAALYTTAMQTSALVEAVTMAVNEEANLASANGIPMSGIWAGTPDLLGITGRVSLSRAIAKVNFNLSAILPRGEVFTLESVCVKQVPKTLQYYRASLENYPYPATPSVMDYPVTTYDKVNLSTSPQSLWWYLPENARGIGTATTQTDKGSKLPTGQAAYCTYLEVKGLYLLGTGQGFRSTYKIYLGANNKTDYNINRNTIYNVSTTIKGIDAADTRIENVVIPPLDYTDNASALFLIAPYDTQSPIDGSSTMNWYVANGVYDATYNPNAVRACPAGWRMPTFLESGLMWIYKSAMPNSLWNTIYWTSTDNEGDRNNAFFRSISSGSGYAHVATCLKSISYGVRCVKDALQSSKYPYVRTNASGELRVIVSRDGKGGVGTNAVRTTNWTAATPLHTVSDPDNNVPGMLEIAKSNCDATNAPGVASTSNQYTWEGAIKACAAYTETGTTAGMWRLPTQRELILILTMKSYGKLDNTFGNVGFRATSYVSTAPVGNETAAVVNFTTGGVDNLYLDKITAVRCVRDVTLPY